MNKYFLPFAAALLAAGSALAEKEKLDASKADVKLAVNGNDQMKFDKTALEAKSGQVVAITFKNVGVLPVQAMGHNLVVLKPGTDITAFALDGIANKDGGYLAKKPELVKAIVASSKILGPNEEETIVFKAGPAGEYPYLCTFPGHFGGMKGILSVK